MFTNLANYGAPPCIVCHQIKNVQKPEHWISWYLRLTMVMGIVMAEFECCHQHLMGFDKVDMEI